MAKPDKIDLIFQLILAICDFWVAETPSFDLRKKISTRNFFHQRGRCAAWRTFPLNVIKIEWKSAPRCTSSPLVEKNFWWKKISKVKRRCFRDAEVTNSQNQLNNKIYLIRFGHTKALLLKRKKSDIKRTFFPSCRN